MELWYIVGEHSLVIIFKIQFINSTLFDQKNTKIDDITLLFANHTFSSHSGNKYYYITHGRMQDFSG